MLCALCSVTYETRPRASHHASSYIVMHAEILVASVSVHDFYINGGVGDKL